MQLILFINSPRKSIKARFPSSLVINQYMQSENSSSECSQRIQGHSKDVGQVFIKAVADHLENSRWTDVYDYANINSNGRADSFLKYFGDAGIKFDVFIRCFKEMLPWLAALDDIHYLGLGLVFLNNVMHSPDSIKETFNQGNFTVNKTSRVFYHGD